jgi:uncharacterized repeat protein (TIGR02543 family)
MKCLYKLLGIAVIGTVISLGLAGCPSDLGPGPGVTYTVSYDGNGSTGGTVPKDTGSPYASGATVTVLDNTGNLRKTGHAFVGWNTRADGNGTLYLEGMKFTITADTIFYARWIVATTYTVTYNGNGSTGGAPPSDTNSPYESGVAVTVLDNTGNLEKTGHTFAGWNTQADRKGTDYAANAAFTITGDINLYAKWIVATTYTVTYDGNGSTGGASPSDTTLYEYGATVTVLDNTGNLEKTGHPFAGWNTQADGGGTGYAANDTFAITDNIILYAKWTVTSYTVTFDADGGNPASQTKTVNIGVSVGAADMPDEPTRNGHIFGGWYTGTNGAGTQFSADTTVTGDIRVYAKWTSAVPGSTLQVALAWLDANAEEGGEYTITVSADEAIAPKTLSYSGKRVSITLDGGTAERTVSLGSSGSLFTVGSGVRLTLGNNVTLRGRNNNSGSLVGVQNNGTLVMQTGSKISGNTDSSADGGGVFVNNGGTFIMEGGSFVGNTASDSGGGGVYVGMGGTFTMKSGSIENNTSSRGGGGVYIYSDGIFTMEGGSIKGNTASDGSTGGGVYAYRDGTFTMKGGSIETNTASNGSGGGVYVFSGGIFTLEGGFLENNIASGAGGGVYIASVAGAVITGGTFTMKGGSIKGNTSSVVGGGGVYVNRDGTFTMKDGSIEGNTAFARDSGNNGLGGGVYVNAGGTFTLEGGSIKGNTTSGDGLGGGVYVNDGGIFTMRNGSIEDNTVFNYGCGSGVSISGIFTMEGGSIKGNTASNNGGGVYIYNGGTFTMKNGSIEDNTASDPYRGGGGVYISGGTFTMEGGSIKGNTASGDGGGVYVYGDYLDGAGRHIYGTFTMEGGSIEGNTASDSGGGVFLNSNAAFSKTGGTISGSDAVGLPANTVTGYTNLGAAVFVGHYSTLLKALEKTVGPGHNLSKEWNDDLAADFTVANGWYEE